MALKKGLFEKYVARPKKQEPQPNANSKYSYNQVFDNPISIQNISSNKKDNSLNKNELKSTSEIRENCKQTVSKLETNRKQTVSKLETNRKQTVNKLETNRKQTGNKLETNRKLNRKQTVNSVTHLSFLTGLQRTITLLIYENCLINKNSVTPPITLEYIASHSNTSAKTIKTTIQRLVKAGLIIRISSKSGRGGWSSYTLSEDIFTSITHDRNLPIKRLKNTETVNKPYTQKETTSLSSSSYINTTTYENINLENIQKELSLLSAKGQFFNNGSLKAIYKEAGDKLTSGDIQTSLDNFTYGLEKHGNEEPYVSMANPGAILFKTLKNGDCWIEERYLTPDELIIKNYYDNICKSIVTDEKQYFNSWINESRDNKYEEYKKRLPSNHYYDDRVFLEEAAKDFQKNIFPELKLKKALEILGDDKIEQIKKIAKLSK